MTTYLLRRLLALLPVMLALGAVLVMLPALRLGLIMDGLILSLEMQKLDKTPCAVGANAIIRRFPRISFAKTAGMPRDGSRMTGMKLVGMIQIGFLDRTPRGRVATPLAYGYFGLDVPGRDARLW